MCSIIGDMKDASLTPDQDVLEGCSHALRVTYTQPGYPGRVGRPGYPGRSPYATQGMVIRPLRHPTPNQDILERWTNLDIQGGHFL